MTEHPAPRPLLIFDGDCTFCRYQVDYWQALTGTRVDYAPYQAVAGRFPDISPAAFAASIWLILPDGSRLRGAAAAMRVLAMVPGRGAGDWCYRRVPGFAALAEAGYRVVAAQRPLAMRLARALHGPVLRPARYDRLRALLLRGLALVYLAAFFSMATQVTALVGSDGISPLGPWMTALEAHFGNAARWQVPMLFWWAGGDAVLRGVCLGGAVAAAALLLGVLPRLSAALCWLAWLSVFNAGQVFTGFQWDLLLLEAGFLALLLPGRQGTITVLAYRVLAAKFMFMAGFAKLASGDPTWRALTALEYHFQTQPLPAFPAWYAHHLPAVVLRAGTAATLVLELALPLLLLGPRRLRHIATLGIIAFELLIMATGSYNFFNLLTILLCLAAFDDAALERLRPGASRPATGPVAIGAGNASPWPIRGIAVAVMVLSLMNTSLMVTGGPAAAGAVVEALAPLRINNRYGLFANMTTERREIIIEGSTDGRHWQAYVLPWQPGPLARRPLWATPHQPRLDWQMWFAALAGPARSPWFEGVLQALLTGQPSVLALFEVNPFPDTPPRFVRARLWRYRFTTPAERAATGHWWAREPLGSWYPAVSLRPAVVRQ